MPNTSGRLTDYSILLQNYTFFPYFKLVHETCPAHTSLFIVHISCRQYKLITFVTEVQLEHVYE